MSCPSATRSVVRSTSNALFTNGPLDGEIATPGAGPIHVAKCRTLSPGSSSGSSSTVPATHPRSGGDARTTTSSFGAAVPRAKVRPFERDSIRRRIARKEARRHRAARRPAHRTRLGERDRAIGRAVRRTERRGTNCTSGIGGTRCHSLRWPSVTSATWRASRSAPAHDPRRARERGGRIPGPGDRLQAIDLVAERCWPIHRARARRS